MLINGPIDADGLDRVIGRIRDQLALAIPLGDGRHATVGASIGTAIAGAGRVDVDLLLREADTAMYAAKHARDNRYVRER